MSDLTPEQAFKRRVVAAVMDHQGNIVATCQAIEGLIEEARREEREAWLDYAALLSAELADTYIIISLHGWRSSRVEQGEALRRRLGFATDEDYAAAIRARQEPT